jgi:hypothetical protein
MPIDKKAFLASIAGDKPADAGDGMKPEDSEPMSCGEQLMAAIESKDASAVDAALREAVAKYGSPEPTKEY